MKKKIYIYELTFGVPRDPLLERDSFNKNRGKEEKKRKINETNI